MKEHRLTIARKLIDNTSVIRTIDKESTEWLNKFNKLETQDKINLLNEVFSSQSRTIRQGLTEKEDVQVLHLGTFKFNKYKAIEIAHRIDGKNSEEVHELVMKDIMDDLHHSKRDVSSIASELIRKQLKK